MDFRVAAPDVEEVTEGDPRDAVLENARRKARAVEGERVLGVDTEVVLEGGLLGKPAGEEQAEEFLRALSGRTHEVLGGICLRTGGADREAVAATRVRFRALEQREIDWYLASGEWRERAGGYAIQGRGAALVAEIEGDYWNVVGLPVALLVELAPDFAGIS